MRSDFRKTIKRLVAERAGYRCSVPMCRRVTIGPGATQQESASTGVAAHIFSASPGGPRGTGGLSEEELASIGNAIWLCSDHARFVDANDGDLFSPQLLLSYKGLHEAHISREQCGVSTKAGWFHRIEIRRSPLFERCTSLVFGKLTLVVGKNETGKSALCEWLAGIAKPGCLRRWRSVRRDRSRLHVVLTYFDPEERQAEVLTTSPGAIEYRVNGSVVPMHPPTIQFVAPVYELWGRQRPDETDLQYLSKLLEMDCDTTRNLVPSVLEHGSGFVEDVAFTSDNGADEASAHLKLRGQDQVVSMGELSGSQLTRTVIEFAVALASFSARYAPTALILDGWLANLDEGNFLTSTNFLSCARQRFQTVAAIPTGGVDPSKLRWAGWSVARLVGQVPGTSVDQQPRKTP